MKKTIIAAMAAAVIALSSCSENDHDINQDPVLLKGEKVKVADGEAWTYIETSFDNKPLKAGIVLTEAAIPEMHTGGRVKHGGHGDAPESIIYTLRLPENKSATVFDHVTMDWNPHGHPPENVYTKAHFDFHFYMESEAELNKIPPFEVDSIGHKTYPAPDYLPKNYIPIPGGVPKMGVHWADITSPELNPQNPAPFTQTFIYGTYNGKVNFYEPMVTGEYLKALTGKFERSIPQPAKYARTGYYPTKMSVTKIPGGYQVELSEFIYRQQS
ncbi:DUF5602 domain-containing protein [Dyadobacter sp. CY327]|jgi:hypothetical protein|uniref:DUF5602 domain-containing protein n=1 Tax=Dyadobacter sp. CY327 TaxID=2907301 RepID=UPI001F3CFC82|nr:DUF5602 domain-containing protein [Dyadobacter sp. CY327]MCE7072574.1 DUF5602 domain-containing protein [Dyadobacter sp. CY327]